MNEISFILKISNKTSKILTREDLQCAVNLNVKQHELQSSFYLPLYIMKYTVRQNHFLTLLFLTFIFYFSSFVQCNFIAWNQVGFQKMRGNLLQPEFICLCHRLQFSHSSFVQRIFFVLIFVRMQFLKWHRVVKQSCRCLKALVDKKVFIIQRK